MNSYRPPDLISLRSIGISRETVLLRFPRLDAQKKLAAHRSTLQQLKREEVRAWIALDSVTDQTRFWLNFMEHTFREAETAKAIQNQLRHWFATPHAFARIYLLAQTNAETPCYDITDYAQRCASGDLSIADRLKGRTVFHLYQTETQGDDLLSQKGVHELAHRILKGYIHEFADFLGDTVVGFCCKLPPFLSPLQLQKSREKAPALPFIPPQAEGRNGGDKSQQSAIRNPQSAIGLPPLSIPWSAELVDRFQKAPEVELLAHLPLIYYETYDSATIRSLFWAQLTQQFAAVCVRGLREFCHQWGLQFALIAPATVQTLQIDVGTILAEADLPILRINRHDKQNPFLVAKLMTSTYHSTPSAQAAICRSRSDSERESHRVASEGVLGFNWWISEVRDGKAVRQRGHARGGVADQNYLSRFLSIGVPKRSVLIISPIGSLWTKPNSETWNRIVKEWNWLCQTIWELGYDFDIVSEVSLATAEPDKDSRTLRLGKASYPLIVLPSCLSLQEETVNLLARFVKARGKLAAIDAVPYLLNGRIGIDPYPLERLLYRWRTSILQGLEYEKVDGLERLLQKYAKLPIQAYTKPDNLPTRAIALQHRQSEDVDVFYLFHRGRGPIETLIEFRSESAIEEWSTATGEKISRDHWHADGNTYMTISFQPQQGRLIVARKDGADRTHPVS